jgi:hypothetical protein
MLNAQNKTFMSLLATFQAKALELFSLRTVLVRKSRSQPRRPCRAMLRRK